jgi:hypothetical protein
MNPQPVGLGQPHKSYISLIINVVLFLALFGALAFGTMAYSGEQTAKTSTSKKVATAVAAAQQTEDAKVALKFTNQIQQPFKNFAGPPTYGSVNFNYPKNYSAYVDETNSNEPINGYFYPDVVPGLQSNTSFALRVELIAQSYNDLLDQFSGNITTGQLTASAYVPPKMQGIKNVQPGTRLDGVVGTDQQGNSQNGSIVLIPVRDKTLKIYTQSTDFLNDFNNVILPSLTFVP